MTVYLLRHIHRLITVCGAILLGLMAPSTVAQTWPSKPIRMIVGFSPGGVADIMTRSLAQRLAAELSTQVIVENRTGADSLIASQAVARAEPDGYTLYVASTAHAVNQSMFKDANFDAVNDFTPITTFSDIPNVVVVHPSLPVETLKDFLNYASKRKGELNYSSSASGTYLATAQFMRAAGIELQRIPYKGAAPAIAALLANDVQMTLTGIGGVAQYADSGKLRILAVASEERNALAPNVETTREAGSDHISSTWYVLLGPGQMPTQLVSRINAATQRILADPEFQKEFSKFGAIVKGSTPLEAKKFLENEVERWGTVISEIGAQQ